MRISDWSSDVCSSDLPLGDPHGLADQYGAAWVTCLPTEWDSFGLVVIESLAAGTPVVVGPRGAPPETIARFDRVGVAAAELDARSLADRSEEHTSALQSLMRTSYAVFFLKKQI